MNSTFMIKLIFVFWLAFIPSFVLAFTRSSDSLFYYITQGNEAYSQLNNEAALNCYLKAFKLDSLNYETTWKLSRTYAEIGVLIKGKKNRKFYFTKAANYAQKAIKINPKGPKGYLTLSIALGRIALDTSPKERVRLSSEIKVAVDKALELDPNDSIAWHVLGRWHRKVATVSWIEKKIASIFFGGIPKESSLEKAAECFQKAIELKPDYINNHLELGLTYEKMKEFDLAIKEYHKVLVLPVINALDQYHKTTAEDRLKKI